MTVFLWVPSGTRSGPTASITAATAIAYHRPEQMAPVWAERAILAFFHRPKASRSGAFDAAHSSFIFLQAKLSFICRRI